MFQLIARCTPLHHTQAFRLLTGNYLGPEYQPAGDGFAAEPGQALSTAGAGQETKVCLRQSQLYSLRCHPEIAGEGQFQTSTQGRPSDLGHADGVEAFQSQQRLLDPADECDHFILAFRSLQQFFHHGQVGPGAKGLLVTPDMHDGYFGVVFDLSQDRIQPFQQLLIQRIYRFPAQDHARDVAVP